MATANATHTESTIFMAERGDVSHESGVELFSGIENDRLEQQEAAARKRLHPFFDASQHISRTSTGDSSSISMPPAASVVGQNESALRKTRGKPRSEPVAVPKPEATKRKGKGKVGTELDGNGFTANSTAESSNNVEINRLEGEEIRDTRNASTIVMGALRTAPTCQHGSAQDIVLEPSAHAYEGGSLDSDPNMSRRKRQKTASPSVEEVPARSERLNTSPSDAKENGYTYNSFRLQLQAAANGDFSVYNQDILMVGSSSPIAQPEISLPQPLELTCTPSKQVIEISSDPISPVTAPLGYPSEPPVDPCRAVPLSSPPPRPPVIIGDGRGGEDVPSRKNSPPRKLLRLNANGKFSSPASKNPGSHSHKLENKSSTSRRSRKSKKQKVAIVKYGASGDSTSLISKKIEDILSSPPRPGPTRFPGAPKNIDEPLLPPKPTHPFFTGKLDRKLIRDTNTPSLSAVGRSSAFRTGVTTSGSDTDRSTSLSPRKRIAEKKDARNQDRSLGLNNSGKGVMSPSRTRVLKVPGALEPLWPAKGMLHVRGLDLSEFEWYNRKPIPDWEPTDRRIPRKKTKLKHTLVQVPVAEDIVSCLSSRFNITPQDRLVGKVTTSLEITRCRLPEALRLPERMLTTAREIQRLARRQIRCFLPPGGCSQGESGDTDNVGHSDEGGKKPHLALQATYQSILTSSTPFDRAECETQSWVHKYAPKCAGHVLQSGREALILRDWLQALTVVSVDTGGMVNHGSKKQPIGGKNKAKPSKKRKKRNEDIDGFIISSDEEANEMDEITDPEDDEISSGNGPLFKRTVVRVGDPRTSRAHISKLANAIVISGPHGCGKTAAVYAVAKELGFEVFEVNAGSRRSGKDVLEKVGEMTRNHLVHRANEEHTDASANDDPIRMTDPLPQNLKKGKQRRLGSLPRGKPQTASSGRPTEQSAENNPVERRKQQPQQRKQSLILLEEIDILFEEDKQFWATVISLITQSKRPIIMTCNDESIVPFDALSLHAILRFTPPPEDLAVDHLLLIAAHEGHILRREAVRGLYNAKTRDLRASIMELDYWCQMGIGDKKSGLEWMMQRWPPGSDVNENGETLRVASKDSYITGMGWLGHEACRAPNDISSDDEEEILMEAWDGWEIDVEDWHERDDVKEWAAEAVLKGKESKLNHTIALNAYEAFLQSVSTADVYAGQGMRSGNQIICDPTQPKPSDKHRYDDVLGWHVLQSDPMTRYSRLYSQMSIYAKILAKRALRNETLDLNTESQIESLYEQDMIENIIRLDDSSRSRRHLSHADLSAAFTSIAVPPVFITPQLTHTISSFDRTSSLVAADLAPYVRTIVSHELHREEQRLRVTGLLSQGGKSRKIRTTRASRSALAGGNRTSIRREKWFDGNVNTSMVLRTGGEGWQEAATRRLLRVEGDNEDADEDVGEDADELGLTERTPDESSGEGEM